LRRIEGLVPKRDLIEVGGGTGLFGVDARDRGWHYCNFDISESAVAFCRDLGLDAQNFPPGTPPPIPRGSADVVVMWEVLEHVWEVWEYLEAVRVALRPGGVFLMSTPNYLTLTLRDPYKWGILSGPPVHLNFFTPSSLERVIRAAGFSSVNVLRKRLYRPGPGLAGVVRSFRFLLGLDEPKTLYGMARLH
jgi:2-polyprenyl-3-methyl-5-hydroxy-6-metoxy-1,4-benzoquinol methylase